MDGSNGWYRVNYSGRANFGYGPFGNSEAIMTGADARWVRFNGEIPAIYMAVQTMLESNDPDIIQHRQTFYQTISQRYNPQYQLILLDFWSSCAANLDKVK